jgi:hypothetical protein
LCFPARKIASWPSIKSPIPSFRPVSTTGSLLRYKPPAESNCFACSIKVQPLLVHNPQKRNRRGALLDSTNPHRAAILVNDWSCSCSRGTRLTRGSDPRAERTAAVETDVGEMEKRRLDACRAELRESSGGRMNTVDGEGS